MAFDERVLGLARSVFELADSALAHESLEPQLAAALRTAGRMLEDIYSRLDANINGDYAAYLQSPHWLRLRELVLRRDQYKCRRCGSSYHWADSNSQDVLHCHHMTYDRRGEERLDDLVTLCARCHKLVHDHGLFARGLYRETDEELRAWSQEFHEASVNHPQSVDSNYSELATEIPRAKSRRPTSNRETPQ
jgi:hypothetical protein